ncbi:hypothetical protein LZG04_19550 [Saccharothrix sp. S26]|uniref:DUF6879 family protein n=1 Tax=Saccharothrix sp. S26 TaxID=2907215 RepID=UPI001F183533|nr:DUF6879 family protein [Saccharothrix sp. S26]MCE6996982.1 hypothetical protein [Saccharothrix sp. S26]
MRPGEPHLRSGGNWLAGDDWARVWREFTTSAFRLETLPEYRVAGENGLLERFRSGLPMPSGFNSAWHERLRSYRSSGRAVQRVRVVTRPPTDYQRSQFEWGYPGNSSAGEDIRVLDQDDDVVRELPAQDFWLFDDRVVVLMHYQDGLQIGRELLADTDPADYVRYKELAMAHSTPFHRYLRRESGGFVRTDEDGRTAT